MKIKKTIKVKCTDGFRQYTNDGKLTLLAEVEEDKEYVAHLHEETQEYFAHDQEGREFLVGEIRWNKELKRNKLVLIEELELVEDKDMFKGAIKLSELKNDEMLLVGENLVIEKEDFVKEIESHRGKEVYTTTEYRASINAKSMLEDAIEREADNMYEGWEEDIWNDISVIEIDDLQNVINKILSGCGNVSYIPDKRVEIDI